MLVLRSATKLLLHFLVALLNLGVDRHVRLLWRQQTRLLRIFKTLFLRGKFGRQNLRLHLNYRYAGLRLSRRGRLRHHHLAVGNPLFVLSWIEDRRQGDARLALLLNRSLFDLNLRDHLPKRPMPVVEAGLGA